ncbi:MAG: hypothetical protein IJG65_02270 [Synergistaceae bacterium]|nr:hypothetical protein [Synergistaceae bacterium]
MIPVPPLEVQAEIVRILNRLTASTTGLISLLERKLYSPSRRNSAQKNGSGLQLKPSR